MNLAVIFLPIVKSCHHLLCLKTRKIAVQTTRNYACEKHARPPLVVIPTERQPQGARPHGAPPARAGRTAFDTLDQRQQPRIYLRHPPLDGARRVHDGGVRSTLATSRPCSTARLGPVPILPTWSGRGPAPTPLHPSPTGREVRTLVFYPPWPIRR